MEGAQMAAGEQDGMPFGVFAKAFGDGTDLPAATIMLGPMWPAQRGARGIADAIRR